MMNRIVLGLICGLAFGIVDVLLMLPMEFPDKKTALLGAFLDRFAIGFVIACVKLPWPGWLIGLTFALLISLPSAVVTKSYAPILIGGAVGGLIRMRQSPKQRTPAEQCWQ
jgi:hypothetical protein